MPTVKTYNPSRVTVIMNGFPMSGFADGTFVAIAMTADGIVTQVGADGEIARAINTDRRCTVTISLQQTSPANLYLSGLFQMDTLTCGGTIGPIMVQDLCGETLFMASQAWVVKPADVEFAKEISTRAWQIETGAPTVYLV
jgi:Protein of unknown function (DUF3277)